MGVFFPNQVFTLFLGHNHTQSVRLRSKIDPSNTSNSFFLTESCELHIITKTRPRKKEAREGTEELKESAEEIEAGDRSTRELTSKSKDTK